MVVTHESHDIINSSRICATTYGGLETFAAHPDSTLNKNRTEQGKGKVLDLDVQIVNN